MMQRELISRNSLEAVSFCLREKLENLGIMVYILNEKL